MTDHPNRSAASERVPAAWRWVKRGDVRWTLDFYPPSGDDIVKGPLFVDPAPVLNAVAQPEKMPTSRPVAFRVPRVVDDKLSKTEFRLFDDEDEARRAACDI